MLGAKTRVVSQAGRADAAPTEASTSAAASAALILPIISTSLSLVVLQILSDQPKLGHERRYFQYRLMLGMILQTD
jgi:hypothetical protein